MLRAVCRRARERQHECGSDTLGGLNLDPAVHRSDAVIDDRQSQAEAVDVDSVFGFCMPMIDSE